MPDLLDELFGENIPVPEKVQILIEEPKFTGWVIPMHETQCTGCNQTYTHPGPPLARYEHPKRSGESSHVTEYTADPARFPVRWLELWPEPSELLPMKPNLIPVCPECHYGLNSYIKNSIPNVRIIDPTQEASHVLHYNSE